MLVMSINYIGMSILPNCMLLKGDNDTSHVIMQVMWHMSFTSHMP